MPAKHTHEYVKRQFEKRGYTLISTEYVNCNTPLQYYSFNPYFHRTPNALKQQQERDATKVELCKKRGVLLIVVPYTVIHKEPFITHFLK